MERLRSQLASRDEDVQKYRHQSTVLEQRLLETEAKLNKAEDSIMNHDDIHDKLNRR